MRVIAVSIFLALCCSVASAQDARAQTDESLAVFGLKLSLPADWVRQPETSSTMAGRWDVGKSFTVTIETESIRAKTSQTFADDVAARVKGKVARDPDLELDGERVMRITPPTSATADKSNPAVILAIVHEDLGYRVSLYQLDPAARTAEVTEALRRGWTFVAPQPPMSYVALREQPTVFLDQMKMKVLPTMRPRAITAANTKAAEMQVVNLRSGRDELAMTIQVERRPQGKTLEQIGQMLIAQMGPRPRTAAPIEWKALSGPTPRVICSAFDGAYSGDKKIPLRFGLVELDKESVVLVGFVYPISDAQAQKTYQDKSEEMLETVEAVKK